MTEPELSERKAALRLHTALRPGRHEWGWEIMPDESTERRWMTGSPQNLFRIEGLWLWGVDDTTLVHDFRPSSFHAGYALSHHPIPGRFFEAGLEFAEFERLIDDDHRADPKNLRRWMFAGIEKTPDRPPHQWLKMQVSEIGNQPQLDIEGPCRYAVAFGTTIS